MPAQFLDQWKQPVSGQTLPIRIKQKVILFLQDDPKATSPQDVGSNDSTVLKVEEKNGGQKLPAGLRRFEITALQDAETVDLIASPDPIGLRVTDMVTFNVLNSQESAAYYRQKVIEIAQSMLGCHYLWGAAGAEPDKHNGMPGRPGAVVLFDPAKHKGAAKGDVMNHVAVCQVQGFNTCAGRAWKLNPPGTYIADPRRKLTDDEMAKETEELSYRTVYKSYGGGRKGTILGERCEDIRHFDCVGFVNYCLSRALGENIQCAISGDTNTPNTGYANQMITITKDSDDQPGDILIYRGSEKEVEITNSKGVTSKKKVIIGAGHIGFSLGNGKGRIHASETEYGVITDTTLGSPIRRVRYPRLA
jgi:cell wall-associated NlpC family hydrolase